MSPPDRARVMVMLARLLQAGEPAAELREALLESYRELPPRARAGFRLMLELITEIVDQVDDQVTEQRPDGN